MKVYWILDRCCICNHVLPPEKVAFYHLRQWIYEKDYYFAEVRCLSCANKIHALGVEVLRYRNLDEVNEHLLRLSL